MDFFIVYIQEAHATDGWQLPANLRDKVLFADPKNEEQRSAVASTCVRDLKIELPALMDDRHNSVERAYTAWPDRMYLIDVGGVVRFKSKPGPFGFHVKDLHAALKALPR